MRLGQVEDLLHTLAEADAEEAAGAHADHRLHDLEAGPLRVVPRMQEGEEARAAVRLEPDRSRAERARQADRGSEHADGRAGDEQHRGQHQHQRDRGAEVGLDDQQHAVDAGERADRAAQLLQRARRRTPRQVRGGPDRERELRELGRLENGGSERNPAPRTVDRGPDREHGEQEHDRDQDQSRRERAQAAVVPVLRDDHQHDPEERVRDLPLEVVVRVRTADRGRSRSR